MSTSKLMKVTYYDPKSQIRLLCYADTVVWDTKPTPTLTALRFGGYPERVQGLADAIYGGATIEIEDGLALVTVVGRAMVKAKGTAARVFKAISGAGINIRMIDQGSSEISIIVGVEEADFEDAVRAIYQEFVY